MLARTDTAFMSDLAEFERAPADTEPPVVPPIEEAERPRRRKASRLRYVDHKITADGVVHIETIAVAAPGFKICQVKRHTNVDTGQQRFVIVTAPVKKPRAKPEQKDEGNV
jgi:hypothetical protein